MHSRRNRLLELTLLFYITTRNNLGTKGTHDAVCVLRESLEGEYGVVRLHDHVARLAQVREHRVRLDKLLREPASKAKLSPESAARNPQTGQCSFLCVVHRLIVETFQNQETRETVSPHLSFSFSNTYDPMPDPVPPAIEWHKTKP